MEVITSRNNPLIKEVRSLKERKYREEKGLFFIEGLRFVEEAFKSGAGITALLLSDRLAESSVAEMMLSLSEPKGIRTCWVPDRLFKEIADTENPQGILAIVQNQRCSLDDILRSGKTTGDNGVAGGSITIVILDSVQDPGNMGTIIRTADAAGVTGIIASKGCVDPYNPKVLRSTMGSIFHVPFCHGVDLGSALSAVKARGIRIFAAHLKGKVRYFDADFRGDSAIIIGNEANGISDEAVSAADVLVSIPMSGKAESLNASVAAGILMYEVVRQRLG